MTEEPHQLLAKLDPALARRFKARLALDGISYKTWLLDRIGAYIAKPAAKAKPRAAIKQRGKATRASSLKKGGVK